MKDKKKRANVFSLFYYIKIFIFLKFFYKKGKSINEKVK